MDVGKAFDSLPPSLQIWAAVIFMAITFFGVVSPQAAKLPGVLGKAARWFQNRQINQVKRDAMLREEMDKAVEKRVAMAIKPLEERVHTLETRLETTQRDLKDERLARRREQQQFQEELQLREEYIIDVHRWYSKIAMWAAERGLRLPVEWPSFNDWLRNKLRAENEDNQ